MLVPECKKLQSSLIVVMVFACLWPGIAHSEGSVHKAVSQTLYVPAYSHIYIGDRAQQYFLTTTLSIRNTDLQYPLTVTSVDYHGTDGKLLHRQLEEPVELQPLAAIHYVIPESDKAGGSGAGFVVRWKSAQTVNVPFVEAVMIGVSSQQGISFSCQSRVIEEQLK